MQLILYYLETSNFKLTIISPSVSYLGIYSLLFSSQAYSIFKWDIIASSIISYDASSNLFYCPNFILPKHPNFIHTTWHARQMAFTFWGIFHS